MPADGRLLSDGDDDNPRDIDGDRPDGAKDYDDDSMTAGARRYHDSDDGDVLAYGHPASLGDTYKITAAVERYFGAARAGDGALACSLLLPSVAGAVSEDYGRAPGPVYLRRGRTCSAILGKLFEHSQSELVGVVLVTSVRVDGRQAQALIGSSTMPASRVSLMQEGLSWRPTQLLASPLA